MTRRFLLSPLTIIVVILVLAAGELLTGTGLLFVAMMAVAMLAICVTYNMLGGLGTIGGVVFSAFALNTLVISQFSKVALFEAADLNLRAPDLTITVYAVFFLSLMVGVFLFAWVRLDLPKPLEPVTAQHFGVMYAVSFVIGSAATIYITNLIMEHPELAQSTSHGLGRAFSLLLPLSVVLAVDQRIQKTEGRACFGWAAFWPSAVIEILGFIGASRTAYVMPPMLVFLTCYFRGFRFKARHYAALGTMLAALFLVVSPWYLWARAWRHQTSLKEEAVIMGKLVETGALHWQQVLDNAKTGTENAKKHGMEYFSKTRSTMLDRLVLIPEDDGVINACRSYHWGLTTIWIDIQDGIPHFIEPHKPDRNTAWFRASVGGLQSSYGKGGGLITTSLISDAWGAFGWPSLIVVPLLLLPWLYVVYDSMFDMSRPWGTVAVVTFAVAGAGGGVGKLLINYFLQIPLYIVLISWFTGWIVRYVPLSGDTSERRVGLLRQREIRSEAAGD